ncbi:hypothetical protein [Mesorhizobium sp. GbtcB19]|uniref:hypothetical protein n=1 Tax=Mesorhizobium sp. GbtcB19 TaxID=2824764 RepID=UPI001C2FAB4F|nr:hypothetical protein [Mesorhizobium sp. GbtcB19]
MSIWDIHYDALYASPIAVDAVLVVACGDMPIELRTIDKTAGIVTGGGGGRFSAEVETISPAAAVRAADLDSIDRAALAGAQLTMNGKTWTVENHAFRPAPSGEAGGEILLILTEAR